MSDEQKIQELFNNWIKSTTEGDLELARQCIADDAVFLVPGAGEMDKETFAMGAAGMTPEESPLEFDLDSKIKEINVFGDFAYLWVESKLLMTPKVGGDSSKMHGHSLAVLKKGVNGWQIFRDANTMTMISK